MHKEYHEQEGEEDVNNDDDAADDDDEDTIGGPHALTVLERVNRRTRAEQSNGLK